MNDLAGRWLFDVVVLTVIAVLDAVVQAFALHLALARARVHAPRIAGLDLLVAWLPSVVAWLVAGILLGMNAPPAGCAPPDAANLWLGVLYPVTVWPAPVLARRAGVRLPRGYWIAQAAVTGLLLLLGLSCF